MKKTWLRLDGGENAGEVELLLQDRAGGSLEGDVEFGKR
jgi:hypothetical protein